MRFSPDERQRRSLRAFARASQVGIFLVLSTVIGFLIGQGLDRVLHTGPWLTLVFFLLGVAAGFIELFRTAIALSKEEDEESSEERRK